MTDKEVSEQRREGVEGENSEEKDKGGVYGRDRKRETEGDGRSGAECGEGRKMEDVWREEAEENKS